MARHPGTVTRAMVQMTNVVAFAGVAAVLIAIPGPSVLFTISRASARCSVALKRRIAVKTITATYDGRQHARHQ